MNQPNKSNLVLRLVRIIAGVLFAAGISLFLDFFGLATALGWVDSGLHQIIGATLVVVAVIDAVLVPRILEKSAGHDRV